MSTTKKRLMAPGDFQIRAKKEKRNKNENRILRSPAYYNKYYTGIAPTATDTGDEYEEYYIPKIMRTCKKCENVFLGSVDKIYWAFLADSVC